jgi:YVTN family beta-propeller protein
MTFDPGGQFAYVANAGSNDVSVFTIDPETGGLTPKGTFSAGVTPLGVAVDPTGRFLYTTNAASSDISAFSVAPGSGLLTLVGTYSAGVRPSSIATVAAETVRPFLPVRGPAFWK